MPQLIQEKALAEITWADIQHLVDTETPEGPTLEFKSGTTYEQHPRNPKPQNEEAAREKTRDLVGQEIVAFANAWGGTLIIGVEEADREPKPAVNIVPITRVYERVEALEKAVKAKIEPPISGLAFRAVIKDGEVDAGAIVIRVPQSQASPHGFGIPPACYIRDQGVKRPMSMREVQSVFWDARTRQERLGSVVDRHDAELLELMEAHAQGRLKNFSSIVANDEWGIYSRITCVPHSLFSLNLANANALATIRTEYENDFGSGRFNMPPHRRANLVFFPDQSASKWTFERDGTFGVQGFHFGHPDQCQPSRGNNMHWPPHIVAVFNAALLTMMRIRLLSGASSVPFQIDMRLRNHGNVIAYVDRFRYSFIQLPPPMEKNVRIGPFTVGSESDLRAVCVEAEEVIWNSFGLDVLKKLPEPIHSLS